ncbi:MAG TPA: glycosyl hydrolase family 18 protein [Bacilli bacterium]|nr:glycosyl hydrolase family 18 protein [Bacilli bacterium]
MMNKTLLKKALPVFLLALCAVGLVLILREDTVPVVGEETPHEHPVNDIPLQKEEVAPAFANLTDHKWLLGYYTVYSPNDHKSMRSLSQYHSFMKEVSTLTFDVTASGEVVGQTPLDGVSLAEASHIDSFAAISNQKGYAFDQEVAHQLLNDSQARKRAVENALHLVTSQGYRGVNVDFENMLPEDREPYNQFIRELSDAFHKADRQVLVSVAAKTVDAPHSKWIGAFDYATLGRWADKVQLMTYDEHGTWGEPGPVASYPWVRNVLTYATSQIPAEKVLLGLPAYGYDWNLTAGKGHHKAVAWKSMPSLLQAAIKYGSNPAWDEEMRSPYLNYTAEDGAKHIVWYENIDSIKAKVQLAKQYQVGGVAMWRMGLEDESFWQAVEGEMK